MTDDEFATATARIATEFWRSVRSRLREEGLERSVDPDRLAALAAVFAYCAVDTPTRDRALGVAAMQGVLSRIGSATVRPGLATLLLGRRRQRRRWIGRVSPVIRRNLARWRTTLLTAQGRCMLGKRPQLKPLARAIARDRRSAASLEHAIGYCLARDFPRVSDRFVTLARCHCVPNTERERIDVWEVRTDATSMAPAPAPAVRAGMRTEVRFRGRSPG